MVTSALVPGLLPVAINGRPYLCDPTYERETVQVIRQQSDTSTEPGEQSLTPLGLWRRSQESWHHGAGQDFLDGKDEKAADPHRFRSSKGVDIWTRGQVSLLKPTLKALSSTNANLHLAVIQHATTLLPYLFVSDGSEVYYSSIPFNGLNTHALQAGTGWTLVNCTVAASPAAGTLGWIRVTATASAAVSLTSPAGTSGVPVDAGRAYSIFMGSKNVSGSGAKTPQIQVNWYDSGGALISTSAAAVAAGTDTPSRTVGDTENAPTNAAYASVTLSWTANWTSGDIHDVGGAIGPADSIGSIVGPDIWNPCDINAGQAAQTVQSLASDGTNLWAALGTSGLHRGSASQTSTADVPAAPASGQISLVGYANGFLLAAGSAGVASARQNSLWRVDSPLTTPLLVLIKTHENTSFQWTGIAGGRSVVYAWGNCGGNGEIYKITYDPNTGTLSTAASPATMLPEGETIHALYFYAGGVILGTGKGVRLGQADGAGNIDYGPLIETDWPVRCLEPQSRWCWFGWTKYDATNSGLGRVDLGYFTDTLTPAWASDLMTADTSTGDVVACVTFAPYGYNALQRPPIRVFTVAGEGVYVEDPYSRVLSGNLETGTIRFSTSEPKTTRSLDVRHHALPVGAPISAEMQRDSSGTWTSLGSSSTAGSYGPATPLDLQDLNAEAMEFRFTLDRPDVVINEFGYSDYTRTPELTRWTAKVLPTPSTIDETFTLTLFMHETIDTTAADGQPYHMDVQAEIAFIKTLERARTIVDFQVGDEVFEGYVVGSKFAGTHWNGPKREYAEGKMTVTLQTVNG